MKKYIYYIPVIFIIFLASVFGAYKIYFSNRIYPGISVAGVNPTGLTKPAAVSLLKSRFPAPQTITLTYNTDKYYIPLADIAFAYSYETTVNSAYEIRHYQRTNLPLTFIYNKQSLETEIGKIAKKISTEPTYPYAKTDGTKIFIEKGIAGKVVDQDKLISNIENALSYGNSINISLETKYLDIVLTQQQAQDYYNRLTILLSKSIKIYLEDYEKIIRNNDLFDLVGPKGGTNQENISKLSTTIADTVNRSPQNPTFTFVDNKVTEFAPAKDGLKVNQPELNKQLISLLAKAETDPNKSFSLEIPVAKTSSEFNTGDVNNLGIKERLGRGVSKFAGSIAPRIFNISLASSKLNGILVKPGETFSFNNTVGDASKENGFQEAYVIKEGKTELGDGGGVCQTSTTLFRTVLNAGLPIVERRAHSYRVAYYEQGSPVGLDATTYYPTTDFKFKNDTPNYLLIQTTVDKKTATLTYDIYGTSDGRVATISKPLVSDVVPAPDDLYIDDPTLPVGQTKQIDWKANGAKVVFNYTVVRNGETIFQKAFLSLYQPWQAKFLRGTKTN